MTPTQQHPAQAAHNSAALIELYAVKDAAAYLRKRRTLAGTHTPEARQHGREVAARMMRDAFEVAERTRASAGPLPSPFETVAGTVVASDGVPLGQVTALPPAKPLGELLSSMDQLLDEVALEGSSR